jgi:O-antigen/teichoic acid export membrane protein
MIKRFLNFLFDDASSLSVGRLMVKGLTWLLIGVLTGRLAFFITRIVAARALGKIGLGEFGLIESTVNMFVGYAGLGMVVAISKNLAESFQPDPQRAGRILATVTLLSGSLFLTLLLAFLLSSKSLALGLSPNHDMTKSLRIGVLLALQVPAGLASAVLNAFQKFRQVTFANIIQGLSSLVLALLLAPTWGLDGVLVAFGSGMLLMFIYQVMIIIFLCRKYDIHLSLQGMTKELPLIWRYGLPSLLGGMLAGPVTWGTRALLAKQASGLGELGLYMAAFSLCSVLITMSALLSNVTIPVLSASKTLEEKQGGIKQSIFLYWMAAIGLNIPLIGLAHPLVNILLGPGFMNAGGVLAILAIAVGTRIFYTSFGALLIVIDRVWHMSLATIAGEPIFLGIAFFLAPLWGAKGLALAYLISSLVTLILLYRTSSREMGWGRIPLLAVFLTIIFLATAWLIHGIEGVWIALGCTMLLFSLFVLSSLYLAFKYELLGGMTAKFPFLVSNR